MVLNTMKTFSTPLVTATLLEEMPRIGERNERFTEVEFAWRASVDVDAFFKTCAPALDAAFSGVALAKTLRPAFVAADRTISCLHCPAVAVEAQVTVVAPTSVPALTPAPVH